MSSDRYIRRTLIKRGKKDYAYTKESALAYADKFESIRKHLILNGFDQRKIPTLFVCKTLCTFPTFLSYGDSRYFLYDINLPEYFKKLNAALMNDVAYDDLLGIWLQLTCERLYLMNQKERCYKFCTLNSLTIKQNEVESGIDAATGIQEDMVMAHEAGHYFLEECPDKIGTLAHILDFFEFIINESDDNILEHEIDLDSPVLAGIVEECFCDQIGVDYVINKNRAIFLASPMETIKNIYRSLCYTSILDYPTHVLKTWIEDKDLENFYTNEMFSLLYRFNYVYTLFLQHLKPPTYDESDIKNVFVTQIEEYMSLMKNYREFVIQTIESGVLESIHLPQINEQTALISRKLHLASN